MKYAAQSNLTNELSLRHMNTPPRNINSYIMLWCIKGAQHQSPIDTRARASLLPPSRHVDLVKSGPNLFHTRLFLLMHCNHSQLKIIFILLKHSHHFLQISDFDSEHHRLSDQPLCQKARLANVFGCEAHVSPQRSQCLNHHSLSYTSYDKPGGT